MDRDKAADSKAATTATRRTTRTQAAKPTSKAAKPVAVYALADPRTGDVRYIGKANCPHARLKSHLRDSRRRDTPIYRWIRKLAADNTQPIITVLAWTEDWQSEERKQIALHRENGCRLLNVAEGGDEPACTYETRAENGRKVAAKRDPIVWAYKRKVGALISDLLRQGSHAHAEKLRQAQALFATLDTAAQRFIAEASARRAGELQ